MGLLTLKPVIYLFNVDEADFLLDEQGIATEANRVMREIQHCDPSRDMFAVVSAKLETEMSSMDATIQRQYLESMGIEESTDGGYFEQKMSYVALPNMVRRLLDLFIVYTGPGVPPERSRTTKAYLYSKAYAPTTLQFASRLHGEIERGFIRAEVAQAATLLEHPTYSAAKDAGVIRGEGKDSVIEDGDVILIKWK